MLKNSYCCYNKNLDVFEIRTSTNNVVSIQEYKYGIQIGFDINMNPIYISIPEPNILFGCDIAILEKIICESFT